jgi:type IV fimbrial biogenesis protein FimT
MKTFVIVFRQASHSSTPGASIARGFTLIELMVTLAVIAVLAGIAGPQLAAFIQNSRLSSAANLLHADLQFARREAIKRNMPVLVCPVGAAGTPLVCGTAWTSGWMICYRQDSTYDTCDTGTSANANPIVTRGAPDSTLVLAGLPTTAPFVKFNANGTQGAGSALSFTVTGNWTGSKTYTLTIPATGNISMKLA